MYFVYIVGNKMKLKQTTVPQGAETAALGFLSLSDVNNTGSMMEDRRQQRESLWEEWEQTLCSNSNGVGRKHIHTYIMSRT